MEISHLTHPHNFLHVPHSLLTPHSHTPYTLSHPHTHTTTPSQTNSYYFSPMELLPHMTDLIALSVKQQRTQSSQLSPNEVQRLETMLLSLYTTQNRIQVRLEHYSSTDYLWYVQHVTCTHSSNKNAFL